MPSRDYLTDIRQLPMMVVAKMSKSENTEYENHVKLSDVEKILENYVIVYAPTNDYLNS